MKNLLTTFTLVLVAFTVGVSQTYEQIDFIDRSNAKSYLINDSLNTKVFQNDVLTTPQQQDEAYRAYVQGRLAANKTVVGRTSFWELVMDGIIKTSLRLP